MLSNTRPEIRVFAGMLLFLFSVPAGAQRNNDWLIRQQQQQQQQRQQQEQMRQQQMRQEQQRQQQERMRQQQMEAQRRQQQEQQRRMQQEAQQRQMQELQRRRMQEMQQQRMQEMQRQQIQNAQRAQQAGRMAATRSNQAASAKPQPTDRLVYSNGIGKLTRPPTTGEMKRGFTGKVTADGRAIVRVRGKVYAIPASRIGVRWKKPGVATVQQAKWDQAKQELFAERIRTLTKTDAAAKVRSRALRYPAGFLAGEQLRQDRAKPHADLRSNEPHNPKPSVTSMVTSTPESAILEQRRKEWVERYGGFPPQGGFEHRTVALMPQGYVFKRTGSPAGYYSAPLDSKDVGLASSANAQTKYYRVLRTIPVLSGPAREVPAANAKGGDDQFMHTMTLSELIRSGFIEEVNAPPEGQQPQLTKPANDR